MTTPGRPLVSDPAPTPEPALTLVLPGYSHFILLAQHSSHEAFGLRTHTRPMPNISMETKDHRQTSPSRHITCSIQRMYQPPPPPPRVENISGAALQPPSTPYHQHHSPWQPPHPDPR